MADKKAASKRSKASADIAVKERSIYSDKPLKFFVIGDNHLKRVDPLGIIDETGRNTRLTDKIDSIAYFVTKALSEKATHITFLGDVYDAVNPPEFLRKAFWDALWPAIQAQVQITIILGNHDTTGAINNFLGEQILLPDNIRIVGGNYFVETLTIGELTQKVIYVPYAKPEVLAEWFKDIKERFGTAAILFGHFEVDGAELAPDNAKLQEGFPKEVVTGLANIVWLGHIHKFQEFRKGFAYIGSMVKCDFGEVTNRKIFGIIDMDVDKGAAVLSYQYVDIPQRPMYQVLIAEADVNNLYLAETIPKEYTEAGVLLKFVLEGSDTWLRSIDKQKFRKRFPKAIRVLFDNKKLDTDRKEGAVMSSNMVDRIHAKVKEKAKDTAHLEALLLVAKEVAEVEL